MFYYKLASLLGLQMSALWLPLPKEPLLSERQRLTFGPAVLASNL